MRSWVAHPAGDVEVIETSPSLQRAHVGPIGWRKPADGPAPWLLRVESLELRSSQRKTSPVRREQPSLRGDVGSSDLGPSQRDSFISRRAAATRVTLWCPDSGLRDTAILLHGRGAGGRSHGVRRGREGEGKAGEWLRPPPPGSHGHSIQAALPSRQYAETHSQGSSRSFKKSLARKRGCRGGRGRRGMHRRAACRKQHRFVREKSG